MFISSHILHKQYTCYIIIKLTMILPGIKLVTFDVTNTLLKFRVPPWDYYALVAQKYGFKGSGQEIKAEFKNSFKHVMKIHPNFGRESIKWESWWNLIIKSTFKDKLPVNEINKISKELIEDFTTTTCWEKADGSDILLKYLLKNDIAVGVVSNSDPRLHKILYNLSLHNYFRFILTSYETGFSKPNHNIFKIAQKKIDTGICASQCLHIGDDLEKDYKGALGAGWNAILVTEQINAIESPKTMNIFKNILDLYEAVETRKIYFS